MEYDNKNNELGISTKFFTDDFEEALKSISSSKVDLKKGDTAENRKIIEKYIRQHIRVKINQQPVTLVLLGFENDHEATWCYYSAEKIPAIHELQISSDFLYESKKEQINIFHVVVNGKRQSSRLSNPEKNLSYQY